MRTCCCLILAACMLAALCARADTVKLKNGTALDKPRVVAALVSLPSDKSFASFEEARAHVLGPKLSNDLDLYWNQQFLDVLLEYPIRSDRSEFAISFRVDRLGLKVATALRFLPPGGESYAQLTVRIRAWYQTVERDTVVAAHGGTARALIAHLAIAPPEDATHYSIDQGVVYVFAGGRLARYG